MKAATEFSLDFDPDKLEDPELKEIFENSTAKIIWCCIKKNHLTDQFFCKNLLKASKKIDEGILQRQYISYSHFLDACYYLLKDFGLIPVNDTYVIDNEFWISIYDMILGGYFRITIDLKKEVKEN